MTNSVIFGFTGTPIIDINAKNRVSSDDLGVTTEDNFTKIAQIHNGKCYGRQKSTSI